MKMSNPFVPGILCAGLMFSAFPALALNVSDTAGTWRVLNFSTPNQFTVQRDGNGIVTGISEAEHFESSTGSLTVATDGTFSGLVPNPITGSVALGAQGHLVVNAESEDGAQSLTFHINRAGDFMTTCKTSPDGFNDLIVAVRAPATLAPADLAGQWNAVGFQSPHHLVLERNSSNQVINIRGLSSFGTFGGVLGINSDGTLSGDIGGAFTGTVSTAPNGVVNVAISDDEGPENHTLFVNSTKDVMVLLESRFDAYDNYQEIMIFQKAPTNNVTSELEGHWRIVVYNVPRVTQVTDGQGRVTGLSGPNRFETLRQHLVMGYDGFFIAQVGGTATGTMTAGASGMVTVNVESEDGPESFNLQLNGRQDLLSTARAISDGYDLMLFTQSAPMPGPVRDFGMVTMRSAADMTVYWAASTNVGLVMSTNLSSWDPVPGTVGQHSYTVPAAGASAGFYRVSQLAP